MIAPSFFLPFLAQTFERAGTGQEIVWEPTWPWPLVVLLVLAGLLVSVAIYFSQRNKLSPFQAKLLLALRCAMFVLLGWMLLGYFRQSHTTDKPDLVLLLDDSASMSLSAKGEQPPVASNEKVATAVSRLDVAKKLLSRSGDDLLGRLGERYHVRLFLMGSSPRGLVGNKQEQEQKLLDLTATQSTSQQGDVMQSVLELQRGRPTAAVVSLTDGIVTQGIGLGEGSEQAARRGIPIFFLAIGSEKLSPHLELTAVSAGPVIYLGNASPFECRLETEHLDGEVEVQLRRAEGSQEVLATQIVTCSARNRAPLVRLFHREMQLGPKKYLLRAEHQLQDGKSLVREKLIEVEVVEPRQKVLFIQGTPSYEYRFLKSLLERELAKQTNPTDGIVQGNMLRTLLQDADSAYSQTDPTALSGFPATKEELFAYDVILLGDIQPDQLSTTAQNHLVEFVSQRGGGLILMAGPKFRWDAYDSTPLANLLPALPKNFGVASSSEGPAASFRPRITSLGQSSSLFQLENNATGLPSFWKEELPPWNWYMPCEELRTGVRVLLEHPQAKMRNGRAMPLITMQFIGAGKVVFHAIDETYLWRYQAGDMYFGRYWMQLLQTMRPAPNNHSESGVELTTNRQQFRMGDTVRFRLRFLAEEKAPAEEEVLLKIAQEDGVPTNLGLRRTSIHRDQFEGSLSTLPAGQYRASLVPLSAEVAPTASVTFEVESGAQELDTKPVPLRAMKEAASLSAGECFLANEVNELLQALPEGREVRIESAPPVPLWNHSLAVCLLGVLLSCEWLLRRRWSLP